MGGSEVPVEEHKPEETSAPVPEIESSQPEVPNSNVEVSEPTEPLTGEGVDSNEPENPAGSVVSGAMPAPEAPQKPRSKFNLLQFVRHMSKKQLMIVGLCVLVLLASGVGVYKMVAVKKQPVSHFSKVILDPFKVVSSTPLPDASAVAADSKITLTFNRAVAPAQMKGDFFLSPQIDGTFSQGKTPQEIVFTPATQFKEGTKFQFMLHGEFTAKDGSKLGADYFGKFTTAIPGQGFYFTRENEFLDLDSLPAGTDAKYQVSAGNDVKTGTTVTIYKSDVNQLLRSFIYQDQTAEGGYTFQKLAGSTVSTDGLSVVSTKTDVADGNAIDFHASAGVYLAVATNGGKQVGRMWVVASDYGVLLRQDDQSAVVALQKLDGSGSASGDVDFYSLKNGVSNLASKQISGQATVNVGFKPRLDIAVGHLGGQVQVVPVAALDSLADVRSMTNLSVKPIAFGTTDKPSYKAGETVHFAGYVRIDNDGEYTKYPDSTVQLYVAAYPGATHVADFSAQQSSDGTFKGSFTVDSSFIGSGAKSQLHIYAVGDPQGVVGYGTADADVASFTATSEAAGQFALKVTFTKSDYLPSDKVTADISGVNADGTPLANTSVNIDSYARQYSEGEVDQTTYLGNQLNKSPVLVQLNAQGTASYAFDVSQLPAGSSQVLTVLASKQDSAGAQVAGSAQAIIHQGNAVLEFGPSRTVVKSNGTLVARVYAKMLNDAPLANASLDYKISSSSWNQSSQQYDTKQLVSGSVTADGSGYATINQPLSNAPSGSLTLTVSTGDSQNNKVQSQQYYYVSSDSSNSVYSDVQLEGLDVYGSQTDVKVGDTLHLTVDAPQALHVLMTLERGRIYKPQALDLHAGKNDLTVPVTSELLPSFNLVFSYFSGGQYQQDGVQFNVSAADKLAAVSFNTSNITPKANSSFQLPLSVLDSNDKGVATHVIFSASESSMFDTASPLTSPIFGHLYAPRERTTNSSSSLQGIGTGGGKCGGGGNDLPDYILPAGSVASWQPDLTTDAGGHTNIPLNLPKGRWHLTAYAMNQDNVVGSTSTDITVN